jgi:flagella basal body P-ring formation protein FlgA
MKAIATLCLCVAALFGGDDEKKPAGTPAAGNPATTVKLKPAVQVRGVDVTVGELGEITPTDAAALAIAQIKIGNAPSAGHGRTVSRTEVLQSIAAAGIAVASFKIEGADETVVHAQMVDVAGQEMLDAATAALQATLAVEGGDVEYTAPERLRHVQAPPGRKSQELRARVQDGRTGPNSAIVQVEILVDGECWRKVPLTFRLQRYHRILKTTGALRAGMPLGPESVVVSREALDQASGLWLDRMEQVEGMLAARNLPAGSRITLGDIAPPAIVHKGDVVTVVLTKGRVKVTARAIANHDAPLGGRVLLTNPNTRATLTGVVQAPGLVVVPQ